MAPNQSGSTSIGLTSERVIPLKKLPYSGKYSTGEALKGEVRRKNFIGSKFVSDPN